MNKVNRLRLILEIIAGIVIPILAIVVPLYYRQNYTPRPPIEVSSLTSVIERGPINSIKIKTLQNVPCTIKIDNETDQIDAESLEDKNSDDCGNCDWNWEIRSDAALGDWKILLTAEGARSREVKYIVTEFLVEPQQLPYDIKLIHYSSPIQKGSDAEVTINTEPNVECKIIVYLPSGNLSDANGLEPKNSDRNGNCAWSWHVSSNIDPGDGKIVIDVQGIDKIEKVFTITDKV
jgi:hypothetical protein